MLVALADGASAGHGGAVAGGGLRRAGRGESGTGLADLRPPHRRGRRAPVAAQVSLEERDEPTAGRLVLGALSPPTSSPQISRTWPVARRGQARLVRSPGKCGGRPVGCRPSAAGGGPAVARELRQQQHGIVAGVDSSAQPRRCQRPAARDYTAIKPRWTPRCGPVPAASRGVSSRSSL